MWPIGIILIEIFFSSSSFALINAQNLNSTPDLVRLEFENKESVCTGFFVTPYFLITAAHCLYSWKDHRLLKLEKVITIDDVEIPIQMVKQIPHPSYYSDGWSPNDLAVIETTINDRFEGNFILSKEEIQRSGKIDFLGAGKIDLDKKLFGRSAGENYFIKVFSFLFSFGTPAIAPNDSGAPVMDFNTNRVIAIASKTTVTMAMSKILPAISISTSLLEKSNSDFIQKTFIQENIK